METGHANLLDGNLLTGVAPVPPTSSALASVMATLDINESPCTKSRQELILRRQEGLTMETLLPLFHNHLVHVDLSRNALGKIPLALANLQHLRHLNLAANALTHFPPLYMLRTWSGLQILDLSENEISLLPVEAPEALTSLVSLNLSGNTLHRLPDSISQCQNLQYLQLGSEMQGGNLLLVLPLSIGNMASLLRLEVSYNQLQGLPDLNTKLEYLDVSHNQLCTLPESLFQRNAALKYLNARQNHLQSIPPVDKTALEWLDVVNNELCVLPESILRCIANVLATGNPLIVSAAQADTVAKERLAWTQIILQGQDDQSLDAALWHHTFHPSRETPKMLLPRLVPSLREMATRRALLNDNFQQNMSLPCSVIGFLQAPPITRCYICNQYYIQEWINTIHVKPYHGHPAVVTKIRLCSTDCWHRLYAHRHSSHHHPLLPPRNTLEIGTLDWMVAAATASAEQMQAEPR